MLPSRGCSAPGRSGVPPPSLVTARRRGRDRHRPGRQRKAAGSPWPTRRAAAAAPGVTATRRRPAALASCSALTATSAATSDPDLRDAQIGQDHGCHAGEIVRAEPGLPPLHPGQAERVAPVESVAGVEVAGSVPHRPAEAPQHGGHRLDGPVGALRDPPVGRLQAEQPAEGGRAANGPASVAARSRSAAGRRQPPPPSRPTSRPASGRGSTGCASCRATRSRCS